MTVKGANDFVADGDVDYTIVTAAATSTDPGYSVFFFNDTATTEIYTLSLHDALPISSGLTTTEGGGTATFTVALTSQPTANVTIGLSSSDLTEGTDRKSVV